MSGSIPTASTIAMYSNRLPDSVRGSVLLDPLDGRRLEDLLLATSKTCDVLLEGLHASLGLEEGLSKGLASASLANEVDEVCESPVLGGELRFLQTSLSPAPWSGHGRGCP